MIAFDSFASMHRRYFGGAVRSGRPSSPSGGFFFTTTMGDIKGGTGPTYRSIHPAAENAFVVGVVCRRYRPVIISFSGSGVYALTSFQRENVSTSWPSSYPAWPGAGASLIGVGVARGCIDTSAIETPSS